MRVARRLGVPVGTRFTRIKRLQLVDREPIALSTYYLAHGERFPVRARDLGSGSLYDYLDARHRLRIAESHRVIRADLAGVTVAMHLGVPAGSALLLIERLDYQADGTPIGYAESQVRGDRYTITSHIVAHQ